MMKTFLPCNVKSIAKALAFGMISILPMLTACSDDNGSEQTPDNPLMANLVGTWLSSYNMSGTVAQPNGQTATYTKAVQALTFNSDGTGTCYRFLCDAAGFPVSLFGGDGDATNGRFRYSVDDDKVVTITRDGEGNAENPKTWTLSTDTDGLTGTDGATTYHLKTVDSDWKEYIAGLEENYRSGANSDQTKTTFLNDWEHFEKVYLEGIINQQYTPWAGSSERDIADAIRFDVQKEAGWEMAFCSLNDPSNMDCRMFGLYNRYTGTLRVFSYVLKPGSQNYGNEMGYRFQATDNLYTPHYPLYNSMEYAIPVNHNYVTGDGFDRTVTLTTNDVSYQPFESLVSAYTRKTTADGVSAGWHCTDFDLSGYAPKDNDWIQNVSEHGTLLSIRPYSQNTSNVLLTGSIIGSLEGEFTDPQYKTTTSGNPNLSKITGTVKSLLGCVNGLYGQTSQLCTGLNALRSLNAAQAANPAPEPPPADGGGANQAPRRVAPSAFGGFFAASAVCSVASCALNIVDIFTGTSQKTEMVSPGTISLSLNAKVDLKGTINSWNSIDDAGITLTPKLLKGSSATSADMAMGKGCFALAKDPVVCVSKEDLLSVSKSISITKNGDHYTSPSFPKDSVRLVSFLDPRSIEFYLNTDIYHDIKDLNINITYGVNAGRPIGSTDCYRQMLKLSQRPTFSITPSSGSKLTAYTTPGITTMTKSKPLQDDALAMMLPDSVKLDYMSGTVLPLYGCFDKFFGQRYVIDPQIFVPFDPSEGASTVFAPVVPDFVVAVMVSFTCRECPQGVVFSNLYIPEIKLISHADTKTYYNDLKAYADKCASDQTVGTLLSDPSIKFRNPAGHLKLAKTLEILKKVSSIEK